MRETSDIFDLLGMMVLIKTSRRNNLTYRVGQWLILTLAVSCPTLDKLVLDFAVARKATSLEPNMEMLIDGSEPKKTSTYLKQKYSCIPLS